MDDDIRYEQHVRRVLRTPLLVLQPLMLAMWPLSLWSNPLIGSPYKPRYLALMLLLLAISALLSVARSSRMMSLTFTGNIWALVLAFRIQIQDGGAVGHYWNLPIALIITLGTCGMTYRLSHYLITLAGAALILFIGQTQLVPAAMPVHLVWLLTSTTLAIGIAYNHANSQWMRRTFIFKERYRILAETDALTGIANRRKLLQQLKASLSLASPRSGYFVMLDIDDFKAINDRLGHQAGDDVLVAVARALGRLDPALQVGRLGGEEFGALALEMEEDRLRALLAELRLRLIQDGCQPVTFSAGIARLQQGEDLGEPLRRADENLYLAKRQGKDQVVWPR